MSFKKITLAEAVLIYFIVKQDWCFGLFYQEKGKLGWEISDIGWMAAWAGASRGTRRTNGVAGGGGSWISLKDTEFYHGIGTLGKEKQE